MRYLFLIIIEIVLVIKAANKNLNEITAWLVGINFVFAFFSINFMFFGYHLSRYKSILDRVTRRQWFNIVILLTLPFVPLVVFLIAKNYFSFTALVLMPIVVFSSIDNALLTQSYLNPQSFLKNTLKDRKIREYLDEQYKAIERECITFKKHLENRGQFKIPSHEFSFESIDLLGLKKQDLWDGIATVLKQAVQNNDHMIYRSALDQAIVLLFATYRYASRKNDDYREIGALQTLSRQRFRGLSLWVLDNDSEGVYIEAWADKLCAFLKTSEVLDAPLSDLSNAIMSDVTFIGSKMLNSRREQDPLKILNTIHSVMELSILQIDRDEKAGNNRFLEKYSIADYVRLIQLLGKEAIDAQRIGFAYRCIETLSYLGCNSARIHSNQSVVACFEALVQLGRKCRKENIGCFWNHCIIPLHLHAEEFMGHILTWLVQDLKENGSFSLKECAEQAYSRLRGFKCILVPKSNTNPKFWIIDEIDVNGNLVPHIEGLSGSLGYNGEIDYSKKNDLTEFQLFG